MKKRHFLKCLGTAFLAFFISLSLNAKESDNSFPSGGRSFPALILKESTPELLVHHKIERSPIADQVRTLPASHSFPVSSVKNQDCLGTCASFGVGALVEYLYREKKLTVAESYFTVKVEQSRIDSTCDCVAGLSLATGMAFARSYGYVEGSHWKYEDYVRAVCKHHGVEYKDRWEPANQDKLNTYVCMKPPADDGSLPKFSLREIYTIFSKPRASILEHTKMRITGASLSALPAGDPIASIKNILSLNLPVVVSVPVWWEKDGVDAGWENHKGGKIKTPNLLSLENWVSKVNVLEDEHTSSPKKKGWHAVLLHGYNDAGIDSRGGIFIFKNSWGGWGDRGHGTIPYTYIQQFSDLAMYGVVAPHVNMSNEARTLRSKL